MEYYNETTYYRAKAKRQWEQSAVLSNGTFVTVPAQIATTIRLAQ